MSLYQELQKQPFLLSGPCVIESQELILDIAKELKTVCAKLGFTYVFKASFDKANRTSIDSFRGPGLEKGMEMLARVKEEVGVPILTDIHESYQADAVKEVVDIIQIPAFLCRQTDLLLAAAETNCIVNVKKAQFLSAKDMEHVVRKLESTNNKQIMLTERGSMYGFNNLTVDFTGVLEMMDYGYPVIMDATHATQKPGGAKGKSGGNRDYAPYLAAAAAAVGVKGFFMEAHPNPPAALSDATNMVYLRDMTQILKGLKRVIQAVQ